MKTKAVVEVGIVFCLILLVTALVGRSPVGAWERQVLGRSFIEYAAMIAFVILVLLVTRRDLVSHGLLFRPLRYHLDIAAVAFIPVALASIPLADVKFKEWNGALIMAGVEIAALLAVAWLLRRKPTMNENGVLAGALVLMAAGNLAQRATLGNAISAILFYVFFLGLGEELLFRGYIQTRLNHAWGRPFTFFGVNWGWGLIITSVLFGLMHVLNMGSMITGDWQITWWWGLWTFFGGLIGGYVREKTGSIVAPTILHGLPQGLAYAFLGL